MRTLNETIPSNATTRSALLNEIRDVLKNRQHVEIYGKQIFIRKILDDLIVYERGTAIIPPCHEEDFTIHLVPDIGFPASDKITVEFAMRQVLQEFGWPPTRDMNLVKFYFTKLMKELYYDRILPVFLFEHPSVLKEKAYRVLEIISQHSVDRKAVGIPSIMCMNEGDERQGSLSLTALPIYLHGGLTLGEGLGIIEEICPGYSEAFEDRIVYELLKLESIPAIKARAKDLVQYMKKLSLTKIDRDLESEYEREKQREKYAKTKA
ncbi:MAG: hypothetical protein Q8896_12525 [Bacteroidota bacterium]|nr:hypothetical protein [Bacteroidota bacterium]MDP4235924.1 hypothetical protein [Bacteroidota bacterium]